MVCSSNEKQQHLSRVSNDELLELCAASGSPAVDELIKRFKACLVENAFFQQGTIGTVLAKLDPTHTLPPTLPNRFICEQMAELRQLFTPHCLEVAECGLAGDRNAFQVCVFQLRHSHTWTYLMRY
eukprot:GDKI01039166.1.p1 GENE.GDKI01039166.1~~GDKI01039166.1.p1  ORF type:complete len:147 (-),score=33.00 GDKI01039166.1:247-624(-)